MKKLTILLCSIMLGTLLSACNQEESIEAKKTINTPNGSTEVRQTTEVEKTGDHKIP